MQNSNPYAISFPEVDSDKIREDFDGKLKESIKSTLKKTIEDVREDIEREYYTNYSNNLECYLDQLVLDKAKALVVGLINGEEQALTTFIKFGYSRTKILESVVDYAARIEVEDLRRRNEDLISTLKFYRS